MGGIDARHVLLGCRELGHGRLRRHGIVPETGLGALALKVLDDPAALLDMEISFDLGEARRDRVNSVLRYF